MVRKFWPPPPPSIEIPGHATALPYHRPRHIITCVILTTCPHIALSSHHPIITSLYLSRPFVNFSLSLPSSYLRPYPYCRHTLTLPTCSIITLAISLPCPYTLAFPLLFPTCPIITLAISSPYLLALPSHSSYPGHPTNLLYHHTRHILTLPTCPTITLVISSPYQLASLSSLSFYSQPCSITLTFTLV